MLVQWHNRLRSVFHLRSGYSRPRDLGITRFLENSLLPWVWGKWQEFTDCETKQKCYPIDSMIQFTLRISFIDLFNDAVLNEVSIVFTSNDS